MAKREAWIACDMEYCEGPGAHLRLQQSTRRAAERYPLPKVERPRVVTDPHSPNSKWRVDRDTLQVSPYDEPLPWRAYPHDDNSFTVTPERVAMWADLLAHPSEFVDDEG